MHIPPPSYDMFAGHQRLFRLTSGLAPGKIATELSGDRLRPPCGVDHFRQSASPGLLLLLTPEMFGRPLARSSRRGHSEKDVSRKGRQFSSARLLRQKTPGARIATSFQGGAL